MLAFPKSNNEISETGTVDRSGTWNHLGWQQRLDMDWRSTCKHLEAVCRAVQSWCSEHTSVDIYCLESKIQDQAVFSLRCARHVLIVRALLFHHRAADTVATLADRWRYTVRFVRLQFSEHKISDEDTQMLLKLLCFRLVLSITRLRQVGSLPSLQERPPWVRNALQMTSCAACR